MQAHLIREGSKQRAYIANLGQLGGKPLLSKVNLGTKRPIRTMGIPSPIPDTICTKKGPKNCEPPIQESRPTYNT